LEKQLDDEDAYAGNNTFALKSVLSGQWVSAVRTLGGVLVAWSDNVKEWVRFLWL
jgi:hypothetical protein